MEIKQETVENKIQIYIVEQQEEKEEIYRFRYHIYAEEMSRQLPSADHEKKLLFDGLDQWAVLLCARVGAEIVGTMRINIGTLESFPTFWREALSLDRFQKFGEGRQAQQFAYSSKIMIAPSYRNSAVCYLLIAKAYEIFCEHQVQFSFCVCNLHLVGFYEQIGFRRYGHNFADSEYGLLVPFVLLTDDIAHFRAVKSPFYRLARKKAILDMQAVEWFCREFAEYSETYNSQLITEELLWDTLCHRLGGAPHQTMPLLTAVSEIEARKFLHRCGVIIQCCAGDYILHHGHASYDLNVLVSGRVKPTTHLDHVLPGQHFGVNGLSGKWKQRDHFIAVTDAEVLVLSSTAVDRFAHNHPDIVSKVMQQVADQAISTLGA